MLPVPVLCCEIWEKKSGRITDEMTDAKKSPGSSNQVMAPGLDGWFHSHSLRRRLVDGDYRKAGFNMDDWLVLSNMNCIFPYIENVIIPID